jgi:hypothetical protein
MEGLMYCNWMFITNPTPVQKETVMFYTRHLHMEGNSKNKIETNLTWDFSAESKSYVCSSVSTGSTQVPYE